jgi:hypothetical protein
VIALLSLLAALAAGTYFRIRNGQLISTTETNLQKINSGLERIWSAERDRIEKEFTSRQLPFNVQYDSLLTACGGPNQVERAKAVWLTLRLKQEFPQTFSEARANITFTTPTVTITLPPKQNFVTALAGITDVTPANSDQSANQSAALLYLILTDKGTRGEVFDPTPLNAFIRNLSVNGYDGKAFYDAYDSPIAFARFFTSDEINNDPYSRHSSAAVAADTQLKISNNPLDFSSRLHGGASTNPPNPAWNNAGAFRTAAGFGTNAATTRQNFIPTVLSAGPNRVWDNYDPPFNAAAANVGYVTYTYGTDSDNIFGFRLRKQAARGD